MDYVAIKTEVLIALRGNNTQIEMSQKLGYSFNQYHKWETNLKWLRWDEFIEILDTLKYPYQKAFSQLLTFSGDPKKFSELINVICANLSPKDIATIIGQTEDVVRRWLRKDICPSTETIFQLIQVRTNNLSSFLEQFIEIEKIHSLKKEHREITEHKKLEVQFPFSGAVEAALNLESYQNLPVHSDEWIANRILVSKELVQQTLEALLKAGNIVKKDGKYILQKNWVQLNGLSPEETARVDRYWTARSLDRYSGPTGVPWTPTEQKVTNIRSFRIAPMSEETATEIQNVLRQTSQTILGLILKDEGVKTKIGVYVSHFYDVQDIHWKKTIDKQVIND